MRIMISSAGRRVYLIEWFRQALEQAQISGEVYVLDHDPDAASAAAADHYRHVPAFTDDSYREHLLELVDEVQPELFLSLNDHELTVLASGVAETIRSKGAVVPVLDQRAHTIAADKLAMYHALTMAGIPTPETVPLSDAVGSYNLITNSPSVIVKDRWGSGSSGLRRFTQNEAHEWLNTRGIELIEHAPKKLDSLILQEDLGGTEYGLDIITPVRGGPVEGLLGRRKLSMRHGETSAAITVPTEEFYDIAETLNRLLNIRGTVDVDVMMTANGVAHVIDINPRFGGGYPFCHIAGADVPHFFLASTLGVTPRPGWNTYQYDFIGAKHEGIIGFESANAALSARDRQQALLRYMS